MRQRISLSRLIGIAGLVAATASCKTKTQPQESEVFGPGADELNVCSLAYDASSDRARGVLHNKAPGGVCRYRPLYPGQTIEKVFEQDPAVLGSGVAVILRFDQASRNLILFEQWGGSHYKVLWQARTGEHKPEWRPEVFVLHMNGELVAYNSPSPGDWREEHRTWQSNQGEYDMFARQVRVPYNAGVYLDLHRDGFTLTGYDFQLQRESGGGWVVFDSRKSGGSRPSHVVPK